jgi:protein arginine N-methyltransferase 5
MAPITSSKLWNEVAAQGAESLKQYETAYVVKMHNHKLLAPAKPVFKFVHPNAQAPIGSAVSESPAGGTAPNGKTDNSRYSSLTFESDVDATLHGFGGYFIARLYGDIEISIEPATHSPGMFSWFPLYIPVRHPQAVAKGDTVAVHVWRCVDGTKVWYEWATTSPAVSPIHNPTGRSYWIGL